LGAIGDVSSIPPSATAQPEPTCSINAPGAVALSAPPSPSPSAAATAHGNSRTMADVLGDPGPLAAGTLLPDRCRTPSSAGIRARRCESKRWPTNRAAVLRLGTELGTCPVRVLPHSPQGPSPPPNAASSPASSASPAAHGRKTDTPGLRVVLHPSDAPNTSPPYSYGRGQPRLGRGRLRRPPGQEMDRIHVGLLVRPPFPLPVPAVHSGQLLMGPVVKRENSQKNFANFDGDVTGRLRLGERGQRNGRAVLSRSRGTMDGARAERRSPFSR
jgi:hypothetical protein